MALFDLHQSLLECIHTVTKDLDQQENQTLVRLKWTICVGSEYAHKEYLFSIGVPSLSSNNLHIRF